MKTFVNPKDLCQIEILAKEIETSLAFYREVFGWHRSPVEIHNYVVLDVPSDCPFGIALIPDRGGVSARSLSTLYFSVDNPEYIASLADKHGGKLVFGPKKLPGYGTIFQIEDPNGQRFGLFAKPANS